MRKLSLLSVLVLAMGAWGCSDDDDKDCVDADGDGYGVGVDCDGTDCDDDDATAWTTLTGYPDGDEDGEYAPTGEQLCVATLPAGYSATAGTDCDDEDDTVWESLTGYPDADGDGFGDATAMVHCTAGTLPAGQVDNDTDCDDTDADVNELMTGYQDYDHDNVVSAAASQACTDGTLPAGWVATAGTDCDDHDVFASADASEGCEFAGTCVDTEGLSNPAAADFRGIGACAGTDCNGADPACADATPVEQTTTCTDDGDCSNAQAEYCMDGNCQRPPACCSFERTGLTCSEIPGCLMQCQATFPNPADVADYFACLQFDCYEGATPKAQYLYAVAQACAAAAGCFAAEDEMSCVGANCWSVFQPCLADEP